MLSTLQLTSFRCFRDTHFEFHPTFNFITGKNGSGKTALLEALSLLSVGRSFRTRETHPLIHMNDLQMVLFAELHGGHALSIQKSQQSSTQIKINTQSCLRTSELTAFLPSQVIYQDLFQIIDAGPTIRRQVLDWGMFHVKPNYHEMMKQYRNALKQRNALLKSGAGPKALVPWNQTLSELATWIDDARADYFAQCTPFFKQVLSALSGVEADLIYFKGWDKTGAGTSLQDVLEKHYETDFHRQYTQYGPHHADFEIRTETGKAKLFLSRGQQKIILLALKIAQAQLLQKPCIYLWDDVCAELDDEHLCRLGAFIPQLPGQFFISGIEASKMAFFQEGKQIELG